MLGLKLIHVSKRSHWCVVTHHNLWLAENSGSAALWRHVWDVSYQKLVQLLIFEGRLAMIMKQMTSKRNVYFIKRMSIHRGRATDQKILLTTDLYSFIKLGQKYYNFIKNMFLYVHFT